MAITETRPEPTSAETAEHRNPWGREDDYPTFVESLGSSDHKTIGRLYIGFALAFGIVAKVMAAIAALHEIPDVDFLEQDVVFRMLTFSRIGLAFLFAIPLLLGLALYLVPLQIGASTIAFPRAAALSFWTWLLGSVLLGISYIADGGIGGAEPDAIDLGYLSLVAVVAALLLASVCVATTIVTLRAPGMRLDRVPLFSWSMLVAASMWLLSLPVLLANVLLVLVDHRYGRPSDFGVSLNQWLQLDWAFHQPQVFALAIPVLGIVGDVVATMTGVRQQRRGVVLAAIAAFGILSFGAWAQPFFNDEVLSQWLYVGMGFTILLPMFAVLGAWTTTLRDGTLRFSTPMLGALAAMIPLVLAGLASGLYVIDPLDLQETPYVQYGVLAFVIGAVTVGSTAGLSYWATKMWGRTPSGVGSLAVLVAFVGALLAGFAFVLNGFQTEAQWVADLSDFLHGCAAVGIALLGLAVLLSGVSLIGRGGTDEDDPWNGQTLEWATSSPPPLGNFGALPEVTSPEPLYDQREAAAEGAA